MKAFEYIYKLFALAVLCFVGAKADMNYTEGFLFLIMFVQIWKFLRAE